MSDDMDPDMELDLDYDTPRYACSYCTCKDILDCTKHRNVSQSWIEDDISTPICSGFKPKILLILVHRAGTTRHTFWKIHDYRRMNPPFVIGAKQWIEGLLTESGPR